MRTAATMAKLDRRLDRRAEAPMTIHSDYAAPSAIEKALRENFFDSLFLDLEPKQIPLVGEGEADHLVHEVHLNKCLEIHRICAEIDERGYKFADPLTAILYALKLPDRQLEYPLCVFFKRNRRLWYIIFGKNCYGRTMDVRRCISTGTFGEAYRYLCE